MSELLNNLQQIYNAKLAIKSAIGTQSDELTDYASYINALKPNGYTYLTENGSYNISAYEYAYVNVPAGTEVEGYAYITENGDFDISTYAMVNVNVEAELEFYTLEGGLFINGQGQYYIADEGDLADYINIIPKEDITGSGFPNTAFSYLTVGKDTTITGYNYYAGDAFAIQAESYTQSSSIAYQTARLANIEPYLIKQYYGLGKYYDSAYITVNRSFNFPDGTQLGIPREVFGYYFPNNSYTNRYENLMVDVSYIVPAGDDIIGLQATAMAFDNTTYALDLQNIRYCDDYMVYDNTYVTATTGIDGTTYYEIDLTQSGNYNDSNLHLSILSGGAFFADMPNGTDDNTPIVHKLEVPGGTFVFDEANWVLLSNNEENTTGSVVFNKDHNNDPALYIDTNSVWWMDENGNWNITGVGELTVNGINSLKIRFYVDSSDNTWKYDWLIDVDYEFTPDEGGDEEPKE